MFDFTNSPQNVCILYTIQLIPEVLGTLIFKFEQFKAILTEVGHNSNAKHNVEIQFFM